MVSSSFWSFLSPQIVRGEGAGGRNKAQQSALRFVLRCVHIKLSVSAIGVAFSAIFSSHLFFFFSSFFSLFREWCGF